MPDPYRLPLPQRSRRTRPLAALLLLAAGACPAQGLVIARTESLLSDISESIMAEAFARSGMTLQTRVMPMTRSIDLAEEGRIDGNLHRIADVQKMFPNLIAVPTPINRVDIAIYGVSSDIVAKSRADIMKLRIGYTRGNFASIKHSASMKTTEGPNVAATLDMLAGGRFDAALLVYVSAEEEIRSGKRSNIVRWPQCWSSEPLYFYLNNKHAALVPRLDAALQQMRREGLIEKRYVDVLQAKSIATLKDPGDHCRVRR